VIEGFHLSGCMGSWHQVTFIFLALWISIFMVTDAQLMWRYKYKKLSHSCSICKAWN